MADCRAVVFDIGNVLLGWEPQAYFVSKIGAERTARLFDEVPLDAMNLEIDRGADFDKTLTAMAQLHPEWAEEIAIWQRDWLHMLGPVLTPGVALLDAVKAAGTPLYALSNFGVQTWELARDAHGFLNRFDRAFISGHYRLIKPDPAFYAVLEDATGLGGEALYFVDDRAENIEAAAARGWRVRHLTGEQDYARMADDLRSMGLITA